MNPMQTRYDPRITLTYERGGRERRNDDETERARERERGGSIEKAMGWE